jgi:hypothetical protein
MFLSLTLYRIAMNYLVQVGFFFMVYVNVCTQFYEIAAA